MHGAAVGTAFLEADVRTLVGLLAEVAVSQERSRRLLDYKGRFQAVGGASTRDSGEDVTDLDFYYQVAYRYISFEVPPSTISKYFKVTGTYILKHDGTEVATYYGIGVKGAAALTGGPAKIYKTSTKIGKNIGRIIGTSSAATARSRLRTVTKSLKGVVKTVRKEIRQPTTNEFRLHPSMIKSPQKALSLAERAARTPRAEGAGQDAPGGPEADRRSQQEAREAGKLAGGSFCRGRSPGRCRISRRRFFCKSW